jgi:hypothetical protein
MNSEFTTQLWCLDALLSRGPGERPGAVPGGRARSGGRPARSGPRRPRIAAL